MARPVVQDTTALGASYLAGLHEGVWESFDDIAANCEALMVARGDLWAELENPWQLPRVTARIIAADANGLVVVWGRDEDRMLGSFQGDPAGIRSMYVGSNGRALVTGGEGGTVRFWDLAAGQCQRQIATQAGAIASPTSQIGCSLLAAPSRIPAT